MYKQVTFLGATQAGIFCQGLFGSGGAFEKVAGAPAFADWETGDEIRKYISTITAADRKKYCYVLVNALGAGEYFGSNINADYFPWNALCHEGDDYGYKTFLRAHAFQHHKNKDPSRAFGIPVLSVLNHRMKRVELIIRLDREKAELEGAGGIITRIDAGEFPDVSMGCFPAGTLVTMADGSRKPIETIQVDDEVITHRGQVKKVTELHRRKYKGSLYSVRAEGHPTVRSTRNHPWATVPETDVKLKDDHANLRWLEGVELRQENWTDAECLDDEPTYLMEPVFRHDGAVTPWVVQPTRAEARLLGYYLAEGHLLRNKAGELSGIELTTHMDDAVHAEIEALCQEFGTKNAPVTFDRANSECSRGIWIFDQRLAEYCQLHAGQYSLEKRLSKGVLSWEPASQREMLGAYANGDGCGTEDGSLKLSTASLALAHQWLLVLPRLGIIPSMGTLHHKPGTGKATTNTTEYVVHIGKQWAQKLRDVTTKVQQVDIEKTKLSRKLLDGKIITPIRELDSIYVEMDVFNFEVEEDNSYLVEGLAVHNCKVPWDVCSKCGHKSKTKEDYCKHMNPPEDMRYIWGPNRILADGLKIYVINLHPRFFDISFVFIGADKTAKVMAKLAMAGGMICLGDVCAVQRPSAEIYDMTSGGIYVPAGMAKTAEAECSCNDACDGDKLAEAFIKAAEDSRPNAEDGRYNCGAFMATRKKLKKKTAEIVKEVPTGVFSLRHLPDLEKSEEDIPEAVSNILADHSLSSELGAFGSMGIVLKPHEYAKTVLHRMGEDDLLSELDECGGTMRPVGGFGDSPVDMDSSILEALGAMFSALGPYMKILAERRSAFGRPLLLRTSLKCAKISLPTKSPVAHPLLDKISAAYNGYRRELLTKLSQATVVVQGDPRLRETIQGEGLVSMFSKQASTALPLVSLDSLSYVMGAYLHDRRLLSNTAVAVCDDGLLDEELKAQGY